MIDLSAKKKFLSWLIQCVTLKRRESYWILNYLLNHEAVLNRVVFVQGAIYTPRGLMITDQEQDGIGLEMMVNKHLITEPEDIFLNIRKERKSILYLEIMFEEMLSTNYYLSVIEENPYQPLDEEFTQTFELSFADFFEEDAKAFKINQLVEAINQALEAGDKESF